MRKIKDGQLTDEIKSFIGKNEVEKAEAFPLSTYRQLVEHVAKLAYLNKDHLLFFRGQGRDFRNRNGSSTFYPTIYRGDYLIQREVRHRFRLLDHASRKLREVFCTAVEKLDTFKQPIREGLDKFPVSRTRL
ncbi:MAG: hypothetical protein JXB38_14570, partial [Anaerolineales bacterium]|nr:hypothetical protein [Anaerolineales bacterium]